MNINETCVETTLAHCETYLLQIEGLFQCCQLFEYVYRALLVLVFEIFQSRELLVLGCCLEQIRIKEPLVPIISKRLKESAALMKELIKNLEYYELTFDNFSSF